MLVEVAWHYQLSPRVSPIIAARQDGLPASITDIAWKAQLRLSRQVQAPAGTPCPEEQSVVAVARELAGFVWAIGREVQLSNWPGLKPT